MNPVETTLRQLRDEIANGGLSATEAVTAYLDRIEIFDPELNVYHEVYQDRALQRATQVDAGEITGPLAGVPISLKDNLCTDYGHTTCCSKILEHYRSPYTATVAQRLEQAGAIVLGKTNLDEFAMGSSTENSALGPTRNPWDTQRVPGGSSGGAAAAVAADLCAGAIGSDTGGSIRQPAALCGVVGLKPTYGRVSRYGLIAFASSLDQIGPVSRTVADAALLLGVMSGQDPKDATCASEDVPDYLANIDRPLSTMRIGVARQFRSDDNDPAMNAAFDRAIETFEAAGAEMVDVALPHAQYGIPTYYIVATAEASSNLARYDGVRYGRRSGPSDLMNLYCQSRAEGFGDEVKRRIMLGTYALSSGYYDAYYLRAMKVRRLIQKDFDDAFQRCDCMLCPTTTSGAFRIGEKSDNPLAMYLNDIYTVNANLAGIPAMTLPAGFVSDCDGQRTQPGKKLPLGIQLLGPVFQEEKLLRIGQVFESATDFSRARPLLETGPRV